MLPLTLLLFLTAQSSSLSEAFEQITLEEAVQRLSKCGLGPATHRYELELDEEILNATGASSVTDEQLACADKAVSYYTLELAPDVQRRYDALREARVSRLIRVDARAWLSARGLLDRVPQYQEGVTDDAVFTQQVEDLCGPRAKGAFQSTFGFHTLSPEWMKLEMRPPALGDEVLSCLMNVTTVAGFKFGFIGNEKYQQ